MSKKSSIELINEALNKIGISIKNGVQFLEPEYYVSTGSLSLDQILCEQRGLPPGIVEIYGAEGVGKSTLALEILSEAQKKNLTTYYFDLEKKLTKSLIKTINGLDDNKINFVNVNTGNDAVKALECILPANDHAVIVIDSIPAMISSAQFEESSDKDFYAPIAKLLNVFLPKARTWVRQSQTLLILLNQIRDNMTPYGPPTRTPGGRALKFNCDIRIEIKKTGTIKNSNDIIGQTLKVETHKNNYAKPFQSVELALIFGHGIDKTYELMTLGLQFGIISKGGAWFTFNEIRAQGEQKLIRLLEEDKELRGKLEKEVLSYLS